MTQRHISYPELLPDRAAGDSARHIHDLRGLAAGGAHFVKCRCRATSKRAEPDQAWPNGGASIALPAARARPFP